MHEMGEKPEKIMLQIDTIGEESEVGTEKLKRELKLFETCLIAAILHGLVAEGKIPKKETDEKERIQSKSLKKLLHISISTSTATALIETDIRLVKEHLQYCARMLYHSLINVEEEQISQKIVKELLKYNIKQTFYSLFMSVSKGTGANIKIAEKIRIEQKIKGRI